MQLVHGLHSKRQPAVGRPACCQLQHGDAQAVHVCALAMPVTHALRQQRLPQVEQCSAVLGTGWAWHGDDLTALSSTLQQRQVRTPHRAACCAAAQVGSPVLALLHDFRSHPGRAAHIAVAVGPCPNLGPCRLRLASSLLCWAIGCMAIDSMTLLPGGTLFMCRTCQQSHPCVSRSKSC